MGFFFWLSAARPEGPIVNSHDRQVVEHNAQKKFVRPAGPTVNNHDRKVVVHKSQKNS
jgi:hypothetical protein